MKTKKSNKIGLLSAIFLGVSAIMGSGWLFAPYRASLIAGPAAIYAWIIGAVLVGLLSLGYAELAAVYPKRGLSAIIPTLSHNKFFGFPFALANWLGVVAVIGLEADATVQYLINLVPELKSSLFLHGQLTLLGTGCSIILVLFYCMVNYWGAKLLARTNNILTVIKLIVPIVVALIIISFAFHPHNFHQVNDSFVPYGFKSVLVALITSGIIVAFNGFQTIVTFASEIKKPHKVIPIALIVAILISLVVYLLLQISFIGALPSTMLAHGWKAISLNAPMVQLSLMLGMGLLASIIYFGATVAPTGAAIAFTGSATRMFTAMSRRDQVPKYFDDVHPLYRVSRRSLLMNTILSVLFVLLFRSWARLAEVLTLLHVISYLPIPIALVVFRNRLEKSRYHFMVPFGKSLSLCLFVVFTYLLTLINSSMLSEMVIFFAIALAVFILLNINSLQGILLALKKSHSVIIYFVGLFILSEVAPDHIHFFSHEVYFGLIVVFSIFAFYLMTRPDSTRKMPERFSKHQKHKVLVACRLEKSKV